MDEAAGGRPSPRPPLLAFLFVAVVVATPYLRAALHAPPGTRFVGSFYFTNDVYHYLSYVQQAEDGALLFRNKLKLEPHRPALLNLEWWLAGRISAVLGRRPMLAWRLIVIPAALALVLLADAWLRRAGLPPDHRLPALVLVTCGAGFGGAIHWLGWDRRSAPVDLSTGLFPFMELLTNPHFVAGTALLGGALLALSSGTRRGTAAGVALAAVAGLVRPYDLLMIVLARGLAVAMTEPPRRWAPLLLPLASLAPVVAYDYWLFYRHPAFSVLSAPTYAVPFLAALLVAVAPAGVLALGSLAVSDAGREARAHLWAWVLAAGLVIALRPVSYSLQFLAGIGFPLLVLAALALARFPPWATLLAAALLSTTALAALRIVTQDNPRWLVPAVRLEAARALRAACRPGDVVMAPGDVGLYALGLSPCSAYVSHPVQEGFEARQAEVRSFYVEWDAAARAGFLDRHRITALVLPGDGGPAAEAWLGPRSPFQRLQVVQSAGATMSIYRRPAGPALP